MKQSGDVVILRFPETNLLQGKPRPALLICPVSAAYDDWLLCLISSQVSQFVAGLDEKISPSDEDYARSGLLRESIIRVTRLAVVDSALLSGKIDEVSEARLKRMRENLCKWILSS